MKQKISRSFIILQWLWRIIRVTSGFSTFAVLICTVQIFAQQGQQPPTEFPIGTFLYPNEDHINEIFERLDESGLNYVVAKPDQYTLNRPIKLMAQKENEVTDYVPYYSKGYYTRWEAERDEFALLETGIKHPTDANLTQYLYGQKEYYLDAWCWASEMNVGHAVDTLIWGPNYRQDKKYRWFALPNWPITFNAVFRMALTDAEQYLGTTPVCRISIFYRYKWEEGATSGYTSITLNELILTKSNFPTEEFYTFTLDYQYPSELLETMIYKVPDSLYNTESIKITDTDPLTGIEFRVDWFDVGKLYVDYVEVYDEVIWTEYIENPGTVAEKIKTYVNQYVNWNSLDYWFAYEEPNTIDSYTPFHIVDSLIQNYPGINKRKPLSTVIYESWNGQVNGDWHLQKFVELAKPHTLMIDWYPFWEGYTADEGYYWLRSMFEYADIAKPDFWYVAQTFGEKLHPSNTDYCWWRKPSAEELNASIMLALAHGSKGILFWQFSSGWSGVPEILCGNKLVYFDALVEDDGDPTPLFYYVKDNLVPRLKGKLGNTLMKLDYTGDYIKLYCNGCPNHDTPSIDYLTLDCEAANFHWHCGFFEHKTFPDNKYFLLTNLRTTQEVTAILSILNNTDYQNLRFANVEGGIDTTIGYNASMPYYDSVPAGEGRLYQVAPVVKYGGRLIYDEYAGEGQELLDDMIIENGATLTIYDNYIAKANIIVKNGRIENGENGKIHFTEGKKIIVDGYATITGTPGSKLELIFTESQQDETTGIEIKAGGSLTIANCKVEDATIGIQSLLDANYLNAQNVDFINCETHSINIVGRSSGMSPLPPPQINGCTMLNSNFGISITNLPGMLIKGNTFTNTACGIFLTNVTDAQVIGNTIISNREEMAGIYFQSSSGAARNNFINGHTVGLHLANSSPVLGSNRITENKYHGMYVGSGSVPYMRKGQFIGNPTNYYATSGYNKIYENGGYMGFGSDNDGSEIYFASSSAVIDSGCNSIYDDRPVSPPLVNTLLLMNGYRFGLPALQAQYNFWGDTVYASRFGSLSVNYIPYELEPCTEPLGGEDELVLMTQFGDVIDTVYSTGEEVTGLSTTELAYAEAEGYFLTGDLTNALLVYEGIINSNATEEEKYYAFQRKYAIGRLTSQSTEYFNQLSNTFSVLSSNAGDSLNMKILSQLSTLSKVGEQEYETAIGEFDNIVQQNPETEEAIYAEIDALTTALLIEESDSTLQKGRLGKYLIKSSANYHQRVDEILRKNFGSESKETEKEILPTEYTLYQNYPNPFNPTTTIKYDLPNTSDVILVIYDILGRKIKELVNTKQQAGRYEVQFDASNLASGVYIYQLIAEKYMQSRKMIVLK